MTPVTKLKGKTSDASTEDAEGGTGLPGGFRPITTPEFIYQQLGLECFGVLVTLPGIEVAQRIENFVISPREQPEKPILVKHYNNGHMSDVRFEIDLLKVASVFVSQGSNVIDAYGLAGSFLNLDTRVRDTILGIFQTELTAIQVANHNTDFTKSPTIASVTYCGKEVENRGNFEEFKEGIRQLFNQELKNHSDHPLTFNRSEFLYRAVTDAEWNRLRQGEDMLICTGTNFEDVADLQVANHSALDGYSGVIIKIPVSGPYFTQRWAQASNHHVQAVLPSWVPADLIMFSRGAQHFLPLAEFLEKEVSA